MGDLSAVDLVLVVLVSAGFILARRALARLVFGVLAYLNGSATGEQRWRRENAVLQDGLEGFFALAGAAFLIFSARRAWRDLARVALARLGPRSLLWTCGVATLVGPIGLHGASSEALTRDLPGQLPG